MREGYTDRLKKARELISELELKIKDELGITIERQPGYDSGIDTYYIDIDTRTGDSEYFDLGTNHDYSETIDIPEFDEE